MLLSYDPALPPSISQPSQPLFQRVCCFYTWDLLIVVDLWLPQPSLNLPTQPPACNPNLSRFIVLGTLLPAICCGFAYSALRSAVRSRSTSHFCGEVPGAPAHIWERPCHPSEYPKSARLSIADWSDSKESHISGVPTASSFLMTRYEDTWSLYVRESMRIHTRFWMDETCRIRPCQLMQRESGVSIPACCLLGEMKIFTPWVLCWDTKVVPSKTLSHLTYISRPKLPQNRLRSLPFGVPAINATLLQCLFFAFRWGTSFLWSPGPPGWGVQLHRRDLAPRCWVSAPRREGAWFGWLTSRWIPMVSCSLREGERFFGDWKVWGYKVFKCVDAETSNM